MKLQVYASLIAGGTIGIFPEGGTHDGTQVLDLATQNRLVNPKRSLVVDICSLHDLVLLTSRHLLLHIEHLFHGSSCH